MVRRKISLQDFSASDELTDSSRLVIPIDVRLLVDIVEQRQPLVLDERRLFRMRSRGRLLFPEPGEVGLFGHCCRGFVIGR